MMNKETEKTPPSPKKSNFTDEDLAKMTYQPLPFTDEVTSAMERKQAMDKREWFAKKRVQQQQPLQKEKEGVPAPKRKVSVFKPVKEPSKKKKKTEEELKKKDGSLTKQFAFSTQKLPELNAKELFKGTNTTVPPPPRRMFLIERSNSMNSFDAWRMDILSHSIFANESAPMASVLLKWTEAETKWKQLRKDHPHLYEFMETSNLKRVDDTITPRYQIPQEFNSTTVSGSLFGANTCISFTTRIALCFRWKLLTPASSSSNEPSLVSLFSEYKEEIKETERSLTDFFS
jgi:hypothetical protein